MNDPHVQTLHYRMHARENVRFDDAPMLRHKTDAYELTLDNNELTVTPGLHFAHVDAARTAVEPFLQEWVLHAALRCGQRQFWFEYVSANVVDRTPAHRPGIVGIGMSAVGRVTSSGTGTITAFCSEYPAPPRSFRATPLVDSLYQVYEAAKSERRLAAAAAYFALTAVKTRVRSSSWPAESGVARSNRVSSALNVAPALLHKLHELTTDKGDITTGRKVSDKAELDNPRPPHTAAELQWMCEAIRLLALRLGEWEANSDGLTPLGMSDLPQL